MKISLFLIGTLFLLFVPFVLAEECPEGSVCDSNSIRVHIEGEDYDKISDPGDNLIGRIVISVLIIFIILIAFYINKNFRKRKAEKKKQAEKSKAKAKKKSKKIKKK